VAAFRLVVWGLVLVYPLALPSPLLELAEMIVCTLEVFWERWRQLRRPSRYMTGEWDLGCDIANRPAMAGNG